MMLLTEDITSPGYCVVNIAGTEKQHDTLLLHGGA